MKSGQAGIVVTGKVERYLPLLVDLRDLLGGISVEQLDERVARHQPVKLGRSASSVKKDPRRGGNDGRALSALRAPDNGITDAAPSPVAATNLAEPLIAFLLVLRGRLVSGCRSRIDSCTRQQRTRRPRPPFAGATVRRPDR